MHAVTQAVSVWQQWVLLPPQLVSLSIMACFSLVRKRNPSTIVNPCTLLLLLIWYPNIFVSYCMLWMAKQLYFSHCSPHKVCIFLVMWLAFLCVVVTALSMFLVRSSPCLVFQHKLYVHLWTQQLVPLQNLKNRAYRMVTTDYSCALLCKLYWLVVFHQMWCLLRIGVGLPRYIDISK